MVGVVRTEDATADLLQQGTQGTGRFVLHTTGVAAGVPVEVRNAGLTGVLVRFEISGSKVVMRHELSSRLLTVDFEVEGDRMIGSVRGAEPEVRVVLTRGRRPVAATPPASGATAPPASVAAEPSPPPSSPLAPAPAPGGLEPPTTPQRIAAATAPLPEPRPGPKEFAEMAAVKPINFDFDKYDIRPGDAKILAANVEWLKTNATVPVLIEGHCDERGTIEYNLALGERRARAARDYLISSGVAAERISIVSFGAERGVCAEATEECWAKNRRAIFLLGPR